MRLVLFITGIVLLSAFTTEQKNTYVAHHLSQLKEGVLLVRLHEDLNIQKKMRELKQYRRLEAKKEEVALKNKELMDAFSDYYSFSQVYFFYARNTSGVVAKDYGQNVFDTGFVKVSDSLFYDMPVYILDGENVHFEHFGEDAEGYGLYNDTMELMQKPFPFYVRKRSGTLIVERTETQMVMKLQAKLDKAYQKHVINRRED